MIDALKSVVALRWLLLGLAALGTAALADPAEFVRGRVVQSDVGERVVRAVVPQDVYEWITRSDLGDVRVFNAAGIELPYRIRRPHGQEEFSPWVELPVFALPPSTTDPGAGASVNIHLDEGGAVVAVDGARLESSERGAYLVDASTHDVPFSQMRVAWRAGSEGFVGRFRLQSSSDLNTWHDRVESATLAELSGATGVVRVDTIELERARMRYLKLTQLEGSTPLEVESVAVRGRTTRLPARQWKTLVGERVDDGFEFATGGMFPLDRVAVAMAQDNYLVQAKLSSRARPKDPWRSRGEHSFYATTVQGLTVTGNPVPSQTDDQFWRVELASADVTPLLRVGWRPDELVFLNQGPAPVVFAYGRGGLAGKPWPMADLLAQINGDADFDQLPTVTLSAPNTLGGPAMRQAERDPVDWRTVLLWSVLLLGVVVVGTFAYRLVKASD